MMTVMGDACMGISSDAGSIPAWSTKKDCCKAVFFCTSGSRTRRERAQLAEANGPVNRLRRRGLKGGYAAGGIPAWSTKKDCCKAVFFCTSGSRTLFYFSIFSGEYPYPLTSASMGIPCLQSGQSCGVVE